VADAQFNLGVLHSTKGEIDVAISNFTIAITTPDVSAKILAKALINRGILLQKKGKINEAMADFKHVLNLQDVPAEFSEKAKQFLQDNKKS
jgi:Tfp pilus assembly protein PilF